MKKKIKKRFMNKFNKYMISLPNINYFQYPMTLI